ncbi:phage major capsid protein [Micromonospora chersina]|uniref:phage major capsid protein n=1 Tax=Micromonospora chersina TaxID=47854 RepID=UPI00378F50BC
MLKHMRTQLKALLEQRSTLAAERDKVLAAAEQEDRAPTDTESAAWQEKRAEVRKLDDQIEQLRGRIKDAEEDEKREQAAADAYKEVGQTGPGTERKQGGARVTSEPMTYGRQARRHSYFLDMARAELGRGDGDGGVSAARERLARHAKELDVEMPAREAAREARAQRALDAIEDSRGWSAEQRASVFERGQEQRVLPNRTDGQGGYFVPPLWLVDEYIELARFGRQTANLCRNMDLPTGTDSINLPKVATGTATGVQTADGQAVTSQDLTDTSVSAPVRTIAGQEDVAIQLLDQSPIAFDEVIFADLIADYNMRLDLQVIDGSGTAGQHLGILNVSGLNAITYTDATPTLPEMYPSFAQGASKIYKLRKLPATAAVVYPSLWYWATAQLDTTNRPLIVPPQVGWNPAGTQQDLASGEGPAGMLSMGLPAYLDGNLPANKGAGTNETRTIIARFLDLYLWEGAMRTRALQEVLSGTLQVRFQVYAYSAFMPHRRPEAISVVSGTGLIPDANY